ncbi:MAG: winged helix-turn-helix domain-containing protein [Methanocellales archaeon]|nr:winged helix-turn-helix domain-containing protein [Methanocellales archaeon]MDI6902886.1 winged helix-turn-helix domain-containing protein [Methanocellales archaeon]
MEELERILPVRYELEKEDIEVARVLSNDKGRAIIEQLAKKPCSYHELSEELGLPAPTIQYHINRLMRLDIVEYEEVRGLRNQPTKMFRLSKPVGVVYVPDVRIRAKNREIIESH